MVQPGASAERRDDSAADRDDIADGRDGASRDRDAAAEERDVRAGDRDDRSRRDADDLLNRLAQVRRQLLDRTAVLGLLDDLCDEVARSRTDRHAASRDRHAASRDREAAEQDRSDAAGNRGDSAGDRDQAAIERQQADPPDGVAPADDPARDASLSGRVARALVGSRQRIDDGRAYLDLGAAGAPRTPDASDA